jgi:hypothetical protein
MYINTFEHNGALMAEITSDGIIVNDSSEALNLIANCWGKGTGKLIVHEKNLSPKFFDLKTGIAGEVLQKFSTYDSQLAVIGDFSKYSSKSLKDFIYESNKSGRVFFLNSIDEAKERLSK